MAVQFASSAPADRHLSSVGSYLRRIDVVDARLNVIMRGTTPNDVAPVQGESLERDLQMEVGRLIARHDFSKHHVATALVDTRLGVRVSRTSGPGGDFYTVVTERTALRARLKRVCDRFGLGIGERELLRLLVGGYDVEEIAARTGESLPTTRVAMKRLTVKLGCAARSAVVALVFDDRVASVEDVRRRLKA